MHSLKNKGLHVDLQILDNECSTAYEQRMTEKWGVELQLVPPDMHRRNAAERAIRSFKAHIFWSSARRSVRATGAVFLVQPVKVSCSDWMAWSCLLERDDVPPWRS